jgi:hypothetical protein
MSIENASIAQAFPGRPSLETAKGALGRQAWDSGFPSAYDISNDDFQQVVEGPKSSRDRFANGGRWGAVGRCSTGATPPETHN